MALPSSSASSSVVCDEGAGAQGHPVHQHPQVVAATTLTRVLGRHSRRLTPAPTCCVAPTPARVPRRLFHHEVRPVVQTGVARMRPNPWRGRASLHAHVAPQHPLATPHLEEVVLRRAALEPMARSGILPTLVGVLLVVGAGEAHWSRRCRCYLQVICPPNCATEARVPVEDCLVHRWRLQASSEVVRHDCVLR